MLLLPQRNGYVFANLHAPVLRTGDAFAANMFPPVRPCKVSASTTASRHVDAHHPRDAKEQTSDMKVWIDQDLCTGDGLCEEIAPDVFTLLDDGLAYVKEGDKVFATAKGNPQGAEGMAEIPDGQLDAVIVSAEESPG